MTAIGYRTGALADPTTARRALVVVLGSAAAIAWVLFRGQWTLHMMTMPSCSGT